MIESIRKIVFVHTPRTSGTSIEQSGELLGCWRPGPPYDKFKHLKASDYKKLIESDSTFEGTWDDYFKFSIIRNPWSRVISLYHMNYYSKINIHSGKSLEYFLTHYKPHVYEHGIQCSDYLDEDIDYLIKFENRSEGIKELNERLGLHIDNDFKSQHCENNKTKKHYSEFYNNKTIEIVKNKFSEDIERFDYTFD